MTVRGLIEQSNVAFIGTTDDPVDSLEWHEKIAADPTIAFKVCPSFRPDKAINITKPGFVEYMGKLAACVGKDRMDTVEDVCNALTTRLEFFAQMGCRASDHGLDYIPFRICTMEEANAAYQKAMHGESLTLEEAEGYQTTILLGILAKHTTDWESSCSCTTPACATSTSVPLPKWGLIPALI